MNKSYLSIGSNVGDRLKNLTQAIIQLQKFGAVTQKSPVYKTGAYGVTDQDDFLNAVVLFETNLLPEKLLRYVKLIEKRLKRNTPIRWGPRTIDIDILTFNNETINLEHLKIPHIEFYKRNFVLYPWSDIAPEFSIQGKSIRQYKKDCTDLSEIEQTREIL